MLPSRLWRQYGDNFSWQSRKVASITKTICVQKDGVYRLCSFASIVKKTVASRLRRCWAEPAVRARLHDGLFDILGLWTCLPKSPLRHRAEESSSLPYVRRRLSHSHLGPAWCGTTWIIGIVYVEIFFFFLRLWFFLHCFRRRWYYVNRLCYFGAYLTRVGWWCYTQKGKETMSMRWAILVV